MVAGDVVNTASRLQQIAPVGSVVVGEDTRRATEKMIDYEPMDAVELKGKADPIPVWRATQARVGTSSRSTARRARSSVAKRAGAPQAGVPADDPRVIGPAW